MVRSHCCPPPHPPRSLRGALPRPVPTQLPRRRNKWTLHVRDPVNQAHDLGAPTWLLPEVAECFEATAAALRDAGEATHAGGRTGRLHGSFPLLGSVLLLSEGGAPLQVTLYRPPLSPPSSAFIEAVRWDPPSCRNAAAAALSHSCALSDCRWNRTTSRTSRWCFAAAACAIASGRTGAVSFSLSRR